MEWLQLEPVTEQMESLRKKILITVIIIGASIGGFLTFNFKKVLSFLQTKRGGFLILIATALLVYAHVEPYYPKFTQYQIKIPKKFSPVTIVQLSDVHLQWPYRVVTREKLSKYVEKINSLNPDFIMITGDLISRYRTHNISARNVDDVQHAFSKLKAKQGIFGIIGNNDYCALDMLLDGLKQAGVTLLRNKSVRVGEVSISGIDSTKRLTKAKASLDNLKIEEAPLKILLAHEPDIAIVSSEYDFDIQFSGHTHGGQCVAPFGLGPILLPHLGRKYSLGLYQVKNMLLYVTTGLGISPLPKPQVRFNNRPEIPLIKLVSSLE